MKLDRARTLGGRAFVAAALAAAATVALGSGAYAAVSPSTPLNSLVGHAVTTRAVVPHASSTSVSKFNPTTGITTTCTLTSSNPFQYFGGPFGGGQEGIAQISCNLAVPELEIVVALVRNNVIVDEEYHASFSSSFTNMTAINPTSSGTYLTASIAAVHWTDGTITDTAEADSAALFLP